MRTERGAGAEVGMGSAELHARDETGVARDGTQRARSGVPGWGSASEPSYYDIPILKAPVWTWEVPTYFYLGGLSAGAFILGRLAERFGPAGDRSVARAGAIAAFAGLVPCAPLLVTDLGDPVRFHHMLRVWKPTSPMNLGAWTLTAYSGFATAAVLRELLRERDTELGERLKGTTGATLLAIQDAAGIPVALLLASYTGVLLSCTANPLWCKNPWIGAHFAASAISAGTDAITLGLELTGSGTEAGKKAVDRIAMAAHIAEAATLAGVISFAGRRAAPMMRGGHGTRLALGVGGLAVAGVLANLPVSGRLRTAARLAAAGIGLASTYSIKTAIFTGGREAARDPRLSRDVTRAGGK